MFIILSDKKDTATASNLSDEHVARNNRFRQAGNAEKVESGKLKVEIRNLSSSAFLTGIIQILKGPASLGSQLRFPFEAVLGKVDIGVSFARVVEAVNDGGMPAKTVMPRRIRWSKCAV